MIKIKDDDFVVVVTPYQISERQVTRITNSYIFAKNGDRIRIKDVVFSGEKTIADKLCVELQESSGKAQSERVEAARRKQERDRLYIEAANKEVIA